MSEVKELTGSVEDLELLQTSCQDCDDDIRLELQLAIQDRLEDVLEEKKPGWRREAIKLNSALRNKRRFSKIVKYAMLQSQQDLLDSGKLADFAGEGSFFEFFLDWLSNGGLETILEFIKTIISLF